MFFLALCICPWEVFLSFFLCHFPTIGCIKAWASASTRRVETSHIEEKVECQLSTTLVNHVISSAQRSKFYMCMHDETGWSKRRRQKWKVKVAQRRRRWVDVTRSLRLRENMWQFFHPPFWLWCCSFVFIVSEVAGWNLQVFTFTDSFIHFSLAAATTAAASESKVETMGDNVCDAC